MRPERDLLDARDARRHPVDDSKYQRVNKGHIVPECYQRNFASGRQVMRHAADDSEAPALRNIQKVCRRGPFYRRIRPDGTFIDDVESQLADIENQAAGPFKRIRENKAVEPDDKSALAQFFGFQLARTPDLYRARSALVEEFVAGMPEGEFRQQAIDDVGADAVRQAVIEHYTESTEAHKAMARMAVNYVAALAAMHWMIIRFDQPLLVYSDRPGVVWPARRPIAEDLADAERQVLGAVEVRIPLSSNLMLLASWADLPDFSHFDDATMAVWNQRHVAGQFNQLTISQADREWAHHPDARPPRGGGILKPFTPWLLRTSHDYEYEIYRSERRRRFHDQLSRNRDGALQTYAVLDVTQNDHQRKPANPRPGRGRHR